MKSILCSYLRDFKENLGLYLKDESEIFERFSIYCILYEELYPNFSISPEDLESINTGHYRGIDNIAFIVNGRLVTSLDEIKEIFEQIPRNRIKVIFEQSKYKDSFSEKDLNYFISLIKDFLKDEPTLELTEETKNLHDILSYIYNNFTKVESFSASAIYSYIGNFKRESLKEFIEELKNQVTTELQIFKNGGFQINILDLNKLINLYDKTKSIEKAEFYFAHKVDIEGIEGVDEAYIGYLPYKEFIKILVDEDGKIRNLFYDNVRDFLGFENIKVNQDIKTTLENDILSFPLLNNGLTIVAETNEGKGNKFILYNFQIVNGCQTSYVIYETIFKKGIEPENLNIPVKLIITKDKDLKSKIIIATNNQTQIPEEQLEALTEFQSNLERFYKVESKDLPIKVFYERRTNQYKGKPVRIKDIINIREQLKLFASVFLEKPHTASASYSKVLKEEKGNLFKENHTVYPYAISGFLNNYFREFLGRDIERKYNKARYHIFLAFRILFEPFPFLLTEINSERKMGKYYKTFKELFKDKERMLHLFHYTIKNIIDNDNLNIDINNQKEFYKSSTTNAVIKLALKKKIENLEKEKEKEHRKNDIIRIYKEKLRSYE